MKAIRIAAPIHAAVFYTDIPFVDGSMSVPRAVALATVSRATAHVPAIIITIIIGIIGIILGHY